MIKGEFGRRTPLELRRLSDEICRRIVDRVALEGRSPMTVLLYWPLADEVCVDAAVETLFREGHTVLLPVVEGDSLSLKKYSGREDMRAGAFGIGEPQGGPFEDYGSIDLAFIPGRAFTPSGARLGRGKGYYDRLLPLLSCPVMGVCFSFQTMDFIPLEKHDAGVDGII